MATPIKRIITGNNTVYPLNQTDSVATHTHKPGDVEGLPTLIQVVETLTGGPIIPVEDDVVYKEESW